MGKGSEGSSKKLDAVTSILRERERESNYNFYVSISEKREA